MKKQILLALITIQAFCGMAKNSTQTVKGQIIDVDSKVPLIGATIMLLESDPAIGTTTDVDGNFILENIPVGRKSFQVKYLGYQDQFLNNILVNSGKEVILNIELEESTLNIDEVVIKAERDRKKPLNEMATVSARSINTEEITRFSGGRNDISRLAGNFAGVSTADDSRNDIVIRGNSPTGVSWRMEGVPIPNPNHFSTLGTTGGPVSALNTNLLATSDFMTSAFPAEYGNATAGVFDVKLRSGNKDKFEFTGQIAAFSGLEFMAEGPINKKNTGSFLVSYRYALTAIAPTGTSAVPFYQDLSFKLDLPNSKVGKFSIFGIGGLSSINFLAADIDEGDLFADPNEDAYVKSKIGIGGITHNKIIGDDGYMKTSLAFSTQNLSYEEDNYINENELFRATEVNDVVNQYNFNSFYNKKVNAKFTFKAGLQTQVSQINTDFKDRDSEEDNFNQVRDFNNVFALISPYFQSKIKVKDRFIINAGLHTQFFTLNNSWAVEPRLGLVYKVRPNHELSLAYGLHNQTQPFPVYFFREELPNGEFSAQNENLDFTQSHHTVLGYNFSFGNDWRLKTELYYQHITGAPVEMNPTSFSVLNAGADFVFPEKGNLVNNGKGRNYGLEVTLEKFFSNGYYGLFTSSLYRSEYKGSDNVWRNTAFDNTYVLNLLVGKEFKVGKEKRNAIFTDIKISAAGGRYYTPVNLAASQAIGEEVLQEDEAFSERYTPYFRLDIKAGFRHNAKKRNFSQEFFVDISNVTNRQNIFVQRYNDVTNEINPVYQNGLFPDILYRIQF